MTLKAELLAIAKTQASLSSVQMAFVPNVVDSADGGNYARRAACQLVLVALDREGLIELRPDSGRARFTARELAACPDGPDGSKLLWIRICNVRQTGIE